MTYATKDKTILVDCDGVLLDWEYAFHGWMTRHGYAMCSNGMNMYKIHERYELEKPESKRLVRMFNESAQIRRLPPLRDAIKYVKKLHQEHGYVFHAITSLSDDEYAQHLRTKNLRELFGDTVFEKYTYLDTGADKDEALKEYEGTECLWVEDKPENAVVGAKVGLTSLLVNHYHNANADFEGSNVRRVNNWKEIYELVIGNNV
jgi:FMN phosphatase YigB (HAD superfamily)